MALLPVPEPKTSITANLTAQLKQLMAYGEQDAQALLNKAPPQWYRPKDWDAAFHDIQSYHAPFDRKLSEEEFIKATTVLDKPGTTTDLGMVATQGDFLHVMERAFRSRMTSSVRSRVHAAARKAGHGHPQGVIGRGLLGYLINLDRLNKGEKL